MDKDQISDENLSTMAAEAARCMDPELYEKGKDHYHHDRVKWVKVFGPRIYAAVSDGKMHTVTIHIDNFCQSTCTCPTKQRCEHIAAVFVYYYGPGLNLNGILPKSDFTASKKASPKNSTVRVKNPVPSVPVMEGPVALWYEYFEREYDRIRVSKKRYLQPYSAYFEGELYFLTRLYDEFSSGIAVHSSNWPSFSMGLYRSHSSLFFMAKLERQIKDVKHSYMDSYQIEKIEEGFLQAFTSTLSCKQREKYQHFFLKAVEVVREFLFQEKAPLFDWLLIYRLMCITIFDSQEWWKKETVYLEDVMMKLKHNEQSHYYAALGLASLKLAAGRAEDALTLLQKLKKKRMSDMLFYLEYLAGAKEWEKLLVWLRWLAPGVIKANPTVFEDVCEYCTLAAKDSNAGEEFMKLVRSWLPRSFEPYAGYLLEAGQFREWVELVMLHQEYTWGSINKSVLRHLESLAPAALIPLYHQWAAKLIEEKNRKSYQEAVRLLKKLRSLYNKQKLVKEWNTFISRLALRYPRMRAFQEELRKGKLISS